MTLQENKVKLSVIVPTYKVEAYIEKCIRSLEDQDLLKEEYEIIVINDGSPDRCREIVEDLQNEFSNIVLINQENQGVSMARNNGMKITKGEFITFVDPDDYVSSNTFKHKIEKIHYENLDILYTGFSIIDEKGNEVWKTNYKYLEKYTFDGIEGYFTARSAGVREPDSSCSKIYRASLIKKYGITYPQNVPVLEDGLFLGKIFAVAKNVGFCDKLLYHRTIRIGSAMNSKINYCKNIQDGYYNALRDLNAFENSTLLNEQSKKLINHIKAKFVVLSLSLPIHNFNMLNYYQALNMLKSMGYKALSLNGVHSIYYDLINMYNKSKLLYPFYYWLSLRLKPIKKF